MSGTVADTLSRLEELTERARSEFGRLTERQLGWKPAPDEWSIAQCLEHVMLANRFHMEHMETAIERGREQGVRGEPPFEGGLVGRMMLYLSGRSVRIPLIAPPAFRPSDEPEREGFVEDFVSHHRELAGLAERAEGLDLDVLRTYMTPLTVLRVVRLSDAFRGLTAHEERHLRQAEGVRRTEEFPAA